MTTIPPADWTTPWEAIPTPCTCLVSSARATAVPRALQSPLSPSDSLYYYDDEDLPSNGIHSASGGLEESLTFRPGVASGLVILQL